MTLVSGATVLPVVIQCLECCSAIKIFMPITCIMNSMQVLSKQTEDPKDSMLANPALPMSTCIYLCPMVRGKLCVIARPISQIF